VSEAQAPASPKSETILVVDDEVISRMVISEYLRDCEYKVIEAANMDEALTVLQHAESSIDAVLCGMSSARAAEGFAISQWIRSNRPDTKVILVGNHARAAEAAGDLCEQGPALSKPYEPGLVLDRIKRLLAARANMSR
jgi:CheY-like chemotaxis protein